MIYFAERTSDGALPIRLMVEGVITREQMQRGTVIVNGVEHVGRLFDTDPTIDRASVELCVELFTDDVMISVANTVVSGYELALYRRHPSGIDRWYPHTVPVTGRQNDNSSSGTSTTRGSAEQAAQKAATRPKPRAEGAPVQAPAQSREVPAQSREVPAQTRQVPAQTRAVPAQAAQMRAETPSSTPVAAEAAPEPKAEPRNKLNAPPITQAVPVTPHAGSATVPPPPPITQTVPTISSITTQLPVVPMPAPTAQIPVTSSAAANGNGEVDAAVIADEVAEAIKRAFAGMGAGS
jgi:hypothetical protein